MIASNQTASSTRISTGSANLMEIDVSGVEAYSPDEVGLLEGGVVRIHDGNAKKKKKQLKITVMEGVRVIQRLGRRGDLTIPSPGISPEQSLQETGLHDPLHGRQACSESNSFHIIVGLVKHVPRRGYRRAVPSQNGDKFAISPPPPFVKRLVKTNRNIGERKKVIAFCFLRLVRLSSFLFFFQPDT